MNWHQKYTLNAQFFFVGRGEKVNFTVIQGIHKSDIEKKKFIRVHERLSVLLRFNTRHNTE